MMRRTQTIDTYDIHGKVIGSRTVTWDTTAEEDNAEALTAEANEMIARLQQIAGTNGNLSSAALSSGARTIARAMIVQLRLHLHRLDSTT